MNVEKFINENMIFKYVAGSHSYGTNTPESDIDYRGICIPPKEYWLGMSVYNQFEKHSETDDITIYNIKKFFELALDCNPNIIEFLYASGRSYIVTTPEWERIICDRHLFLSKRAMHTFSGYAFSQLARIKTHRKWVMNPPIAPPSRKEFGLPEDRKALNHTDLGAFDSLVKEGYVFTEELMSTLTREKQYQAKKKEWDSYQNWLTNRNPKRFAMEQKCGYDAKHASHLVRLLRMGKEILQEHTVNVFRKDADELLAIKNGAWTYDQIVEYANKMEEEMKELYVSSSLQKEPKRKETEELLIRIVEEYVFKK